MSLFGNLFQNKNNNDIKILKKEFINFYLGTTQKLFQENKHFKDYESFSCFGMNIFFNFIPGIAELFDVYIKDKELKLDLYYFFVRNWACSCFGLANVYSIKNDNYVIFQFLNIKNQDTSEIIYKITTFSNDCTFNEISSVNEIKQLMHQIPSILDSFLTRINKNWSDEENEKLNSLMMKVRKALYAKEFN